ncbi:MAG: GGDEF domain-containing protein, partial [Oscillospiraceae bacterium]
ITLTALSASLIFLHRFEPLFVTYRHVISPDILDLMRAINILFNLLLLFAFSGLFILEIRSLIEKLNLSNEQLIFTATHDPLTGLYNRNRLRGTLEKLDKCGEPFCIVMGDIDDFKKVNDTYGHDCGDVVLKSIAEIIMTNIGERDIACRWGGEEMLIIMYGSYDDCYGRISNIKSLINSLAIDHEDTTVRVSMTFGFAASGEDEAGGSMGIDAMISTVDKRLYKGKASGKNVIIA